MRLQMKYNMQRAANDPSFIELLDRIRRFVAIL